MRHAGRQQADGAELVSLRQLSFQRDALGDVVDQNDAAHGNEIAREQGSDGDVGGALLAGAGGQGELVEVMHALLVAEAFQSLDELRREDGAKRLADGLGAAEGVHGLHLRVPAFDAVVEIEGQDADVDGLDDVFVELLEPLEFADLFFQAGIEAGVLQGDADVAGQRFEQFDVFAGEEVAADGAAQADDGDGARSAGRASSIAGLHLAGGYTAGEIVVQVEQGGGALLVAGQMQGGLRVFEEDVGVVRWPGRSRGSPGSSRSCSGSARFSAGSPWEAARRRRPASSGPGKRPRAPPAGCVATARRWIPAGP